jgi:hypothetical protein
LRSGSGAYILVTMIYDAGLCMEDWPVDKVKWLALVAKGGPTSCAR